MRAPKEGPGGPREETGCPNEGPGHPEVSYLRTCKGGIEYWFTSSTNSVILLRLLRLFNGCDGAQPFLVAPPLRGVGRANFFFFRESGPIYSGPESGLYTNEFEFIVDKATSFKDTAVPAHRAFASRSFPSRFFAISLQ